MRRKQEPAEGDEDRRDADHFVADEPAHQRDPDGDLGQQREAAEQNECPANGRLSECGD